jgi:hypothetical protein
MLIKRERSWLGLAASAVIGAGALTLIQYWARENVRGAPRLDTVGKRALAKSMKRLGMKPPKGRDLERAALIGDLISNSLFYGIFVAGKRYGLLRRALFWGGAAGLGAVALAPRLGLGRREVARDLRTKAMTVGMYTAGGLASATASRVLSPLPL